MLPSIMSNVQCLAVVSFIEVGDNKNVFFNCYTSLVCNLRKSPMMICQLDAAFTEDLNQ